MDKLKVEHIKDISITTNTKTKILTITFADLHSANITNSGIDDKVYKFDNIENNEDVDFEATESLTEYMINSYMRESNIKDLLSKNELKLIKHNPNITKDNSNSYIKYKGSTHDGTFLFVHKNYLSAINSIYNLYIDNKDKINNIEFGNMTMESDFGVKNINDMKIHGQTDIVIIPINIKLKG